MSKEIEISIEEIKDVAKGWFAFILSHFKIILLCLLLSSTVGFLYALLQKPTYIAELTFTSENEGSGNIGAYAGIAAQFGLDLGSSSSNAFEGENLMRLMSSSKLIQKALFTSTEINRKKYLLINYFLKNNYSKYIKSKKDSNIVFSIEFQTYNRNRDSVLKKISKDLSESLDIQKIDKRSDIISVKFKDHDELFAKAFVEELVNNVIQYYTDYKIRKTRQNVTILQHQTDSVRNLINGNIVDIAISSDLNVNPTRQIVRTGIQRKQVDAQVNGALYTELVKNLELSKLALRKETPLIQVIDTPMLPLEKKKLGRLAGVIIFGFVGFILALIFLTLKKVFSSTNINLTA